MTSQDMLDVCLYEFTYNRIRYRADWWPRDGHLSLWNKDDDSLITIHTVSDHNGLRSAVIAWCKAGGFAGLTLEEFIEKTLK